MLIFRSSIHVVHNPQRYIRNAGSVLPAPDFFAREPSITAQSTFDEAVFRRRLLASLVASRKACGVRQVDLAERLGKPQSYVSKIERGERGLDVGEYVAWMHAIGLNPSGLLAILLDPDDEEEDDDDWHYVLQRLGAKLVSD